MATATIELERLSPPLGARVHGVDLSKPHPPGFAEAMRKALGEHCVLCVSNQNIDNDDQIRFARIFGKADAEFLGKEQFNEYDIGDGPAKRGVLYISNLKEDGKNIGALPDGELHFHSDGAQDRKSTRLNSSHIPLSRMPSSA